MSKHTITGKLGVWLTPHSRPTLADMQRKNFSLAELTYSDMDMTRCGWAKVGEAEMTITLLSDDEILVNKLTALREELRVTAVDRPMRAPVVQTKIDALLELQKQRAGA